MPVIEFTNDLPAQQARAGFNGKKIVDEETVEMIKRAANNAKDSGLPVPYAITFKQQYNNEPKGSGSKSALTSTATNHAVQWRKAGLEAHTRIVEGYVVVYVRYVSESVTAVNNNGA